MNSILALQSLGLVCAVIMHGVFFACSRIGERTDWPLRYAVILMGTGSLLSLEAMAPLPWFTEAIGAALCIGALGAVYRGSIQLGRVASGASWLCLIPLVLDLWWAAFPTYRYDQWNYHLPISKIISELGVLPLPYFDDHKYFTGGYEYLFLLPRLFIKNDFLIQTTSNAFTWLVYCTLLYGTFSLMRERLGWRLPAPILLTLFALFAAPEHEALYNAKPNLLLTPISLMIVTLVASSSHDLKRHSFWVGLLSVLAVTLKVTWLHFGLALALAAAVMVAAAKLRPNITALCLGLCSGLALALPVFLKNQFFFGNPLHPGQILFFDSARWLPSNAAHWLRDSRKAQDLMSYLSIVWATPFVWFSMAAWYFIPVAAYVREWRANWNAADKKAIGLTALILVFYWLIWPYLFDPRHQPRYADPTYGAALLAVITLMRGANPKIAASFWLVVPLLFNSSLDVKLRKMGQGYIEATIDRLYPLEAPPYNIYHAAAIINEHRQRTFPGALMTEHITISDSPALYLLDSLNLRHDYYDHEWLWQEFARLKPSPCVWSFIEKYSINYVYNHAIGSADLPLIYRPILNELIPLDRDAKILFLPPDRIKARMANDPDCQPPASDGSN